MPRVVSISLFSEIRFTKLLSACAACVISAAVCAAILSSSPDSFSSAIFARKSSTACVSPGIAFSPMLVANLFSSTSTPAHLPARDSDCFSISPAY